MRKSVKIPQGRKQCPEKRATGGKVTRRNLKNRIIYGL